MLRMAVTPNLPEKYIEYIRHLQDHDAPVGGIGIHGHIDSPVGPIIMLWRFWELFMSRSNAHLENAKGDLNETGRRYLALKHEWLSNAHGHIDEQGQFSFSGFHGSYEIEVISDS